MQLDGTVDRWKTFHRIMHSLGFTGCERAEDYGGYYAVSFTRAVNRLMAQEPER